MRIAAVQSMIQLYLAYDLGKSVPALMTLLALAVAVAVGRLRIEVFDWQMRWGVVGIGGIPLA